MSLPVSCRPYNGCFPVDRVAPIVAKFVSLRNFLRMCVRTTFQGIYRASGSSICSWYGGDSPRVRPTDVDIGGKPHITTAPRLAPDRDTRQAVDRYSEARPQSPPRCGCRPPPG